jgi:hypothetical protein
MSVLGANGAGLVSALADLRLGTLLSEPAGEEADACLENLAAAAPELFATERVSWELVFGRLQLEAAQRGYHDVVLVSDRHVYIVLRSGRDPDVALVGVAPHTRNVGLVLSTARERLQQVEQGGES